MAYPEKIPSNIINSFNFSFSNVTKNQQEVEKELDNILERINKIIDSEKFYISGVPVLRSIYHLSPTKSDLKKLAKACDRLADILSVLNDLQSKMTVIKMAKDNPNWLTFAFGDFQEEIDRDINSLFTENQ